MGSLVVCSISRSGRRYTSLFFTKVLGATGLAEEVPRPRLIGEAIARAKHLRRTRPQVWIEEVGKPGVSKPRRVLRTDSSARCQRASPTTSASSDSRRRVSDMAMLITRHLSKDFKRLVRCGL
jgi:hypothetical protein